MNCGEVSQIFFSGSLLVSPECAQHMLCLNPRGPDRSNELSDAIAPSHLVAVLESICVREMQPYIDHDEEILMGSHMECKHRAPLPLGALVRVNGWVIDVELDRITFGVQASDEREIVCEGRIGLTLAKRSQIQKRMQYKREAIKRRELFDTA